MLLPTIEIERITFCFALLSPVLLDWLPSYEHIFSWLKIASTSYLLPTQWMQWVPCLWALVMKALWITNFRKEKLRYIIHTIVILFARFKIIILFLSRNVSEFDLKMPGLGLKQQNCLVFWTHRSVYVIQLHIHVYFTSRAL